MGEWSTDDDPSRDFSLTPDDRREVACPAKGGDTIASGRCIDAQRVGCFCPKALGVINAMQEVADARTPWVREEPGWKIDLQQKLYGLRQRADALIAKGVTHVAPKL